MIPACPIAACSKAPYILKAEVHLLIFCGRRKRFGHAYSSGRPPYPDKDLNGVNDQEHHQPCLEKSVGYQVRKDVPAEQRPVQQRDEADP